jgi:hypothetical protein
MRKPLLTALSVLLFMVVQAQTTTNSTTYRTALGVKVWDGAGISLKHFFRTNRAGEFIGYFWKRGFRLTGLYEIHGDISGAPGLKWYIGPGAHLGFYNNKYNNNGVYAGIDGVVGLDYKFRGAPINVSLDWQPSFEFGEGLGFNGSWGGLGIRYTF